MDADAVLIGAGVRFNAAVPSPAAFNRLITHAMVKAEPTGDKTLAGADAMLMKANFAGMFPAGSEMTLVKVGYVNCHQTVCELMMQVLTSGEARSLIMGHPRNRIACHAETAGFG